MLGRKAISPLVATILLVVFALIIGTATMSLGKNYITESDPTEHSVIMISVEKIYENPLKELQVKYINDKLTLDEYIEQEAEILKEMKPS